MKILHISHLYPVHYDPMMGIAMHKQIKELKNHGVDVKVIAPIPWAPFPFKYFSPKWKNYSLVPSTEEIDIIQVFHPRYLTFPKAWFMSSSGKRLNQSIREVIKGIQKEFKFDLIHAHMALPDGYAALKIALEYKIPVITTFQATDLDIFAKKSARSLETIKRTFQNSSMVIAPSPRLAKTAYELTGISPEVIGYGFYKDEIFSGDSDFLKEYESKHIILSASRLLDSKGIDLNLRAVKKLQEKHDDIIYLIIGDGPFKGSLQKLVHDLNIEPQVRFLGQLPHSKVMEYMSICDIFSMPSWQETFGLVFLEAMAHGKPVIGCRGQGVDGIIEQEVHGFLPPPKDIDSIVDAMDFLLSNPDKAREMGEKARELVLNNYTWEKCGEKTIEVYKEVLENAK